MRITQKYIIISIWFFEQIVEPTRIADPQKAI